MNHNIMTSMVICLSLALSSIAGAEEVEPVSEPTPDADATPTEAPTSDPGDTFSAEETTGPEPAAAAPAELGGAVALKVGGTFHTLFTELSPFVLVELEGGLTLLQRHLEIDLSAAWAEPPATGQGTDERLGETGDYSWELAQDFLMIGATVRYRFLEADSFLNVYAGLGPRVFFMRTVTTGEVDGAPFGTNEQTETRFGGAALVGGELTLGPGAILLEAAFGLSDLDGRITGDTSSSALDVLVGYRLFI